MLRRATFESSCVSLLKLGNDDSACVIYDVGYVFAGKVQREADAEVQFGHFGHAGVL